MQWSSNRLRSARTRPQDDRTGEVRHETSDDARHYVGDWRQHHPPRRRLAEDEAWRRMVAERRELWRRVGSLDLLLQGR